MVVWWAERVWWGWELEVDVENPSNEDSEANVLAYKLAITW